MVIGKYVPAPRAPPRTRAGTISKPGVRLLLLGTKRVSRVRRTVWGIGVLVVLAVIGPDTVRL